MKIRVPNQIGEFFSAAGKSYSYNLARNLYIWFGILWGLPIPFVTIFYALQTPTISSTETPLLHIITSPMQLFFLCHPLLFGCVFGILGTIRAEKDQKLTETIRQLMDMTIHDPLTGLKNRRHFAHIFHDECARSLRQDAPLTLLFLDIDHFKAVNDTHGHYFGDVVLKEISRYLLSVCRPYDTAVRWGGEEFLILLSATDEDNGVKFAERIRRGVEEGFSPEVTIPVTVSMGLAQYHHNDTLESITDRADQALYHAKESGRNTVVAWSSLT